MSTARILIGDVRAVLATLPDNSVDLVLTSPPFLALRSYLPADHPDKPLELGSEATPGEYLDNLLDVIEACDRVLAPHGSIAIELGDTYAGGGDSGWHRSGDEPVERYRSLGTAHSCVSSGPGWPLDKSLTLIPEMFRFALAYGVNPFTGRTTPRWRIRNVIRWSRPNPPVGALADKMRPATSDMAIACHARDRYFDLDGVRTTPQEYTPRKTARVYEVDGHSRHVQNPIGDDGNRITSNPAGAPPLDWWLPLPEEQAMWDQWADQMWVIPTAPYPGSHYATWPPMLCVRPIEAMCPRRVCTTCGKPSERITEPTAEYDAERCKGDFFGQNERDKGMQGHRLNGRPNAAYTTLGWTDCGCPGDHWRNGVVLDCFGGSGTTGSVAVGHGRNAVLIDLDERNAQLAVDRIGGLFAEVSYPGDPLPDWLVTPHSRDEEGDAA